MSLRSRTVDTWRPLIGRRYASDVARRRLSFLWAFAAQLFVWALAWTLVLPHLIPTGVFAVLIVASGAVSVAMVVRIARFGRVIRRDLRAHGIDVREVPYARRPSDVEQWAERNHVDLARVAEIGDRAELRGS